MNDQMPPVTPVTEEPKQNRTVLYVVIGVIVLCCCCAALGGIIYYLYQNGDQIFGTGTLLLQALG